MFVLAATACSKAPPPGITAEDEFVGREPVATPAFPDIYTLTSLMNSGDSTSSAISSDLLDRSVQFKHLNAFITLDVEGAMKASAELDRLRSEGRILGPLHGIPLVVKDNIHVAGLPNTAGTPGLDKFIPDTSNEVVARLVAAGAVILGKTNLHELAFGITSSNTAYGSVANPWDYDLFPGGSSGGTAAAVAMGLSPAGLGTDTGGSVRIPAALTGVVGFRPSSGRYPSTAVTPISSTRDTIGLISRTVDDLIVLDGVIVPDSESVKAVALNEIRLGIPRAFYYEGLDAQTSVVVEALLTELAAAGVQLVDMEIPDLARLHAASSFPIVLYEAVRDLPAYLDHYATGTSFAELVASTASPDVKGLMASLSVEDGISDADYTAALEARELMRGTFNAQFRDQALDAIIFPSTILPARPIEGSMETVELNGTQVPTFPSYIRNTEPASLAALPGISLPAGLTASGLPVGIEIDGPEQSDRHLLAIAKTLEAIIGFDGRPQPGNKKP
jgi:mandelamide amidase